MRLIWERFRGLIIFSLLYILGAAAFYIARGNWEFVAYVGVTIAIGALLVATVDQSNLDGFALWGLSIWGFMHMLGGILPVGDDVLYAWRIVPIVDGGGDFYILKMDQVVHFYGFAVAAVVVHQLIASRARARVNPAMLIFFAWAGAMGLGALNEVVEFLAYVSLDETGVGDHYNTGLDLIFNLAGALCGAVVQQLRSGGPGVPEGALSNGN